MINSDKILSTLTVRLKDLNDQLIGSGVLYYSKDLRDKVYVLTAAHCLYSDGDGFQYPIQEIKIDLYNPNSKKYISIFHNINFSLVSNNTDEDVALLILSLPEVELITDTLPLVLAIKNRQSVSTFISKGFPNATMGKELVCIYPTWIHEMTEVHKFQLQLNEDYTGWSVNGFSGSGIFLLEDKKIYLYGIFARYREEEAGRVIYCQYIDTANHILVQNYYPTIQFTFFGEHGLDPEFFNNHIDVAINNLGPRFNEKLNFRLPIASLFYDIAKDVSFQRRLQNAFDGWVSNRNSHPINNDSILDDIEAEYGSLRNDGIKWILDINWSVDSVLNINPITDKISDLNNKLQEKRDELQKLQWDEMAKQDKELRNRYDYRSPYEQHINRLREIISANYDFIVALDKINIRLSNYPCLIIKGDAGCGKSHLLGDIASERQRLNKPTILLLGQLFKKEQDVWANIFNQLGLNCTRKELLETFNSIGKQAGTRLLILIDALNEGAGKEIWIDELNGFIKEIQQYSYVGIVLTVRSTYYNAIVPTILQKSEEITNVIHEGFKGNEYEVLRMFCEYHGLQQPNFPILAPEFTNPLFLQLICEGLKESDEKVFPKGFQGLSKIFNYYIKSVSKKLYKKREEYSRSTLAEDAIKVVSEACFNQEKSRVLSLKDAEGLFDKNFPSYPFLLHDLIQENVLIQSLRHDYKNNKDEEVIYFAYERFGDYYIAEQLLLPYDTPEKVKNAFRKNNKLGKLIQDCYHYNNGIIEAMSVLLPEKFNLEIVEVYNWVFLKQHENLLGNVNDWLTNYLLDSLKWRKIESLDNVKLSKWINSSKCRLDFDQYLYRLIELTALPNHPFNSDRLHWIFKDYTMAERDSFWQQHLYYFRNTDDNNNAYPIKRLIDWAWMPNISNDVDAETARLAAQSLSWVLSSTDRQLRDRTTKAMVNLLENQPGALINILDTFNDIDDAYISVPPTVYPVRRIVKPSAVLLVIPLVLEVCS